MKKLLVSLLLVVSATVTLNISAMNALDYLVTASKNGHKEKSSGSGSSATLLESAKFYLTENYLTDTQRTFEKNPHRKTISVFGDKLLEASEMQQHKEKTTKDVVTILGNALEEQKDIQTKMDKDIKGYKKDILFHVDMIINGKIEKVINFKNIIEIIKKYIPLEVLLPVLMDAIHKSIIKRTSNKTDDLIFDKIKVIIKSYNNKKDPLDTTYEESFTACLPQKIMPFNFKSIIWPLLTTLPKAYSEKDLSLSEKLEHGITLDKIIWLSSLYLFSKDKSSNFILYLSKKLGSSLLAIAFFHIMLKEVPTLFQNQYTANQINTLIDTLLKKSQESKETISTKIAALKDSIKIMMLLGEIA